MTRSDDKMEEETNGQRDTITDRRADGERARAERNRRSADGEGRGARGGDRAAEARHGDPAGDQSSPDRGRPLENLLWLGGDVGPLDYGANGWDLFPLHSVAAGRCTCGHSDCDNPGKHPRTAHGLSDATANVEQLKKWIGRFGRTNWGWRLPRGWWALDVDPRKGGHEELRKLERTHGPLPMTLRQRSGSDERSEHWIFADDGVRQGANIRPGLDTRVGPRGYLVVAPGIHAKTGRPYRWLSVVAPVHAPAWLLELVRAQPEPERKPYRPPTQCHPMILDRRRRYALAALTGEARAVAEATEGTRNDRLNKAWWRVLQFRDVLPESESRAELERAASSCGLDAREIARVLR